MSGTSRSTRSALRAPSPREIETTAARAPGREVSSIFLGGGTPSLMKPQTVGSILDAIGNTGASRPMSRSRWRPIPTSVEATRFAGYRSAGVNRVSLGVQALDDASLKALGRLHTAREALDAVAIAAKIFERYSFDLIYARPDQTPEMWTAELKRAIAEAAEHLSLYQLTIEEGTPSSACMPPASSRRPDEGLARALYDVTQEVCAATVCRPTRFPITPAPAPNANTTSSTGAARNMPASARARMAGSISTASATRSRPKSAPRRG